MRGGGRRARGDAAGAGPGVGAAAATAGSVARSAVIVGGCLLKKTPGGPWEQFFCELYGSRLRVLNVHSHELVVELRLDRQSRLLRSSVKKFAFKLLCDGSGNNWHAFQAMSKHTFLHWYSALSKLLASIQAEPDEHHSAAMPGSTAASTVTEEDEASMSSLHARPSTGASTGAPASLAGAASVSGEAKAVAADDGMTASGGRAGAASAAGQASMSGNIIMDPKQQRTIDVSGHSFTIPRHFSDPRVLGIGAYGVVISATHTDEERQYAIKKIPDVFEDVIDAKRVMRELRLLRTLKHPCLLRARAMAILPPDVESARDLYIFSTLMDTDLQKVIHVSRQQLSTMHIQFIVYQIFCALKYLHSANIMHRDIKPANVLINRKCEIRLCDFGMACPISRESVVHATTPGAGAAGASSGTAAAQPEVHTEYVVTRWYRAPEVMLVSGAYTQAVDVWGAACVFAETLLGKPLFPGKHYLDQLKRIFRLLGRPGPDDLSYVVKEKARRFVLGLTAYPGKPFAEIFPTADRHARELLARMLTINPHGRITVNEALESEFFLPVRHAPLEEPAMRQIDLDDIEHLELSRNNLRRMAVHEVQNCKVRGSRSHRANTATSESSGGTGTSSGSGVVSGTAPSGISSLSGEPTGETATAHSLQATGRGADGKALPSQGGQHGAAGPAGAGAAAAAAAGAVDGMTPVEPPPADLHGEYVSRQRRGDESATAGVVRRGSSTTQLWKDSRPEHRRRASDSVAAQQAYQRAVENEERERARRLLQEQDDAGDEEEDNEGTGERRRAAEATGNRTNNALLARGGGPTQRTEQRRRASTSSQYEESHREPGSQHAEASSTQYGGGVAARRAMFERGSAQTHAGTPDSGRGRRGLRRGAVDASGLTDKRRGQPRSMSMDESLVSSTISAMRSRQGREAHRTGGSGDAAGPAAAGATAPAGGRSAALSMSLGSPQPLHRNPAGDAPIMALDGRPVVSRVVGASSTQSQEHSYHSITVGSMNSTEASDSASDRTTHDARGSHAAANTDGRSGSDPAPPLHRNSPQVERRQGSRHQQHQQPRRAQEPQSSASTVVPNARHSEGACAQSYSALAVQSSNDAEIADQRSLSHAPLQEQRDRYQDEAYWREQAEMDGRRRENAGRSGMFSGFRSGNPARNSSSSGGNGGLQSLQRHRKSSKSVGALSSSLSIPTASSAAHYRSSESAGASGVTTRLFAGRRSRRAEAEATEMPYVSSSTRLPASGPVTSPITSVGRTRTVQRSSRELARHAAKEDNSSHQQQQL